MEHLQLAYYRVCKIIAEGMKRSGKGVICMTNQYLTVIPELSS